MPTWDTRYSEYQRQHGRLHYARGRAAVYLCATGCGAQAQQWAWRHDTDRNVVMNYDPMCIPCHVKYDKVGVKRGPYAPRLEYGR